MPPKGKSKAQTAPRPAEKARDGIPQTAAPAPQPSTSGANNDVNPLLAEYPLVESLMLKVRMQAANLEIPSGASAAMDWLDEFNSKLNKVRENPMDEDVVLPPPTTARKTATRKTAARKTTTRKAVAEPVASGTKRRTRARKLAEESQIITDEVVIVEEIQVTTEIVTIEKYSVVEKIEEVEEEIKPVPAKRRTTRKNSAVKDIQVLTAVEIPPIIDEPQVAENPLVDIPSVEETLVAAQEAIVTEDHPMNTIEERPTAEGRIEEAIQEEQIGDGDVSMRLITPELPEQPAEEPSQKTGTNIINISPVKVIEAENQMLTIPVRETEEEQKKPVSVDHNGDADNEWVNDEHEEEKPETEDLVAEEEKVSSQEEARPVEEHKRHKVMAVATEERNRAAQTERMRALAADRAKKAAEKREELERARQAKVEAQVMEKERQDASKKSKADLTKQRHLDAEKRRQEELERYRKLASKNILIEGSPVKQTHYSGLKGASASKMSTPLKHSAVSLGDSQKTPPKLPSRPNAGSSSKASLQSLSQQPGKGFKQVANPSKIFTPLQMPRVNVDGLRLAQKHVADRAGSSQKVTAPVVPSIDSLRGNLTDSQQKASQSTSGTSSVQGSQEAQRPRANSPLMGGSKKPPSGAKADFPSSGDKDHNVEPVSDSLVRQTASMSLKDQADIVVSGLGVKLSEVEKKKEEGWKPASLPVPASRTKLNASHVIDGGEKSSKEGTFSTANSTFILPSTAADDKPIPPATETRKPSPEIPAPSFSAFDAAKSIFSKVTHPFTAFHKEKPVTKVPPVVTPALVDTPESSNPFSTFHIEKPANMNPPSIIPSKSHTETLKSANPFSGSNSSVRSPKPADVLSSSHSEKLNGNTQANNAVGSSKSSSEVTKPFSTFQQDKLKNTSDGNTTTIISAVARVPASEKVAKQPQVAASQKSHKSADVVEVVSSKPPEKHNSKKRPAEDLQSYGLDIHQDDDTDDEENPKKAVPPWAQAPNISGLMRRQLSREIDLDQTFEGARPSDKVNLGLIFQVSEHRFNKRTSSQHWSHPPLALGTYTPHGHLKKIEDDIEKF